MSTPLTPSLFPNTTCVLRDPDPGSSDLRGGPRSVTTCSRPSIVGRPRRRGGVGPSAVPSSHWVGRVSHPWPRSGVRRPGSGPSPACPRKGEGQSFPSPPVSTRRRPCSRRRALPKGRRGPQTASHEGRAACRPGGRVPRCGPEWTWRAHFFYGRRLRSKKYNFRYRTGVPAARAGLASAVGGRVGGGGWRGAGGRRPVVGRRVGGRPDGRTGGRRRRLGRARASRPAPPAPSLGLPAPASTATAPPCPAVTPPRSPRPRPDQPPSARLSLPRPDRPVPASLSRHPASMYPPPLRNRAGLAPNQTPRPTRPVPSDDPSRATTGVRGRRRLTRPEKKRKMILIILTLCTRESTNVHVRY